MNIPCAKRSNFCVCTDNPLANLSSEEPDYERFIRIDYFPVLGPPPILLCEDASLEDLANCPHECDPLKETCPCTVPPEICCQDSCEPQPNPCPSPPCCKVPPCTPTTIYWNAATTCTECGYTVTIPAGVYSSPVSQADADAIAMSVCLTRCCTGPGRTQSPCYGKPKPIITGYGQTSPITALLGSDLIISVSYSYSGSFPLTFEWYKDFIPFANTPGPSLTLNDLTLGDAGVYQLKILAAGCPGANSAFIQLIVEGCSTEGDPCPIGPAALHLPLETDSGSPYFGLPKEVEWETFTALKADFIETPFDPGSTIYYYKWPNQPDHPPGKYQIEYVSGLWTKLFDPGLTPPGPGFQVGFILEDEEKYYTQPFPNYGLTDLIMQVGPPAVITEGIFTYGTRYADAAAAQADFTAYFNGVTKRRWGINAVGMGDDKTFHDHTNDGGTLHVLPSVEFIGEVDPEAIWIDVAGNPVVIKIVQVDGLIQQPRSLQVSDWATVGPELGVGMVTDWDGLITTRTTYTDTVCLWDEAGFLSFGGATCYYTQTHPTAPNGCGWVLEISDFLGVVWIGYKIVDDVGNGTYHVAATSPNQTVPCIILTDATP